MTRITAILREIVGLFIDDYGFALTILVWLAAVGLILPRIGAPTTLSAMTLPVGLAAILIESAVRRARRSPAPSPSPLDVNHLPLTDPGEIRPGSST